jgi:hypothetical protein
MTTEEEALVHVRRARESGAVKLDLSAMFDLERLPEELTTLTNLQSLNLFGCEKLGDLSIFSHLPSLRSLDLSRCETLCDLSPLARLTKLKSLNLAKCEALNDVSPLVHLTKLRSLNLSKCGRLSDFLR